MISLDSSVVTVVGDAGKKRDALVEGLGLRTVGDLLRHFPRRYVDTGSLTRVEDLHEGQMVTVVGEVSSSAVRSYRDRRTGRMAYRTDVSLRTDGPALTMTFFSKAKHVAEYHERRYGAGRTGIFIGQVRRFRSEWQLTNPTAVMLDVAAGDTDDDRRLRELLLSAAANRDRLLLLLFGVLE